MTVVLRSVAEAFGPQIPPPSIRNRFRNRTPPYRGGCAGCGMRVRTPVLPHLPHLPQSGSLRELRKGRDRYQPRPFNVPGLNYEHKKPRVLGGSHENALELVKTLIVIFPIVNFPAEGSQNPMNSHFPHIPKPT